VIKQPAKVVAGGAQCGELPRGKKPFVLGRQAPVCLMAGHGKKLAQRGPKIILYANPAILVGKME
jgi:hypothetical protein